MFYTLFLNDTRLGNFRLSTITAMLVDWEESPPHHRSQLHSDNPENDTITIVPNLMH